jgi:hypothetical protein
VRPPALNLRSFRSVNIRLIVTSLTLMNSADPLTVKKGSSLSVLVLRGAVAVGMIEFSLISWPNHRE